VRNVFDAGRYITWASGRGLGPGNGEFFGPCEKWHRANRRVPFGLSYKEKKSKKPPFRKKLKKTELLTQRTHGGGLFLAPAQTVRRAATHVEGDGAPAGGMVHEYGEGALLLLQDVLAGGAATHHLPRPTVLRHGQVGVHQAVVTRLTCKS
jgi:hypothetical protein